MYNTECLRLLNNDHHYKKLSRDPTEEVREEITFLVDKGRRQVAEQWRTDKRNPQRPKSIDREAGRGVGRGAGAAGARADRPEESEPGCGWFDPDWPSQGHSKLRQDGVRICRLDRQAPQMKPGVETELETAQRSGAEDRRTSQRLYRQRGRLLVLLCFSSPYTAQAQAV
ncbi:hypothetical protein NDU88_004904 [Pleurodeles waltl]|uniref:Uncharacterized protein n=1 Tax=Pleurodeles waltl TaxID=8319 RepID=A0AAV7T8X8_PLEWA|nr:hypothetical protein NDU88_004904 [Pleurodeles waltl]